MTRRSRRPSGQGPGSGDQPSAGLVPGAPVQVIHAKPWKRTITMRGTVSDWDGELLTIERQFSGGGSYDSLNLPILRGDWGTIEVPAGGRLLRRAYYRQDGTLVGELFNVQTPAEIEGNVVRYVDLEVDVVRFPDGRVVVVDEEDLAAAVRIGGVSPKLAEQALALAYRLAEVLRAGGDWRSADVGVR